MSKTAAESTIKANDDPRLVELRAVLELLRPDADDPKVLSEITSIEAQIAQRQPDRDGSETCPACGGVLLWAGGRLICPRRSCKGTD